MAYDHELADRIREALSGRQAGTSTTEKAMFGGLAFLVNGNLAVAASGQGGLLVRIDPARTDELLAQPGAEEFAMGTRGPMSGWLHVRDDVLDDDGVLAAWVDHGVGYAETLPRK
jgi:TfoX/Sxy family transcriptional regulator of competence genes